MNKKSQLYSAIAAAIMLSAGTARAGFDWSWTEDQADAGKTNASAAQKDDSGFEFSWEKEKAGAGAGKEPAPGAKGAPAVDAEAYGELVKDNLALRGEIERLTGERDRYRQEKETLARDLADLERKVRESVTQIKALESRRSEAEGNAERIGRLESELAAARAEKDGLDRQVEALRAKVAETRAEVAKKPGPESAVAPGSDLYENTVKENLRLKQELAALKARKDESDRKLSNAAEIGEKVSVELESARKTREDMERKLAQEAEARERMRKLVARVPELEKEISQLESELAEREDTVGVQERQLRALSTELEVREDRLNKVNRTMELIRQVEDEVRQRRDLEKRDMHYNMAVVYQKEGRYREAVREYLHALRIDPNDADTHYNLGLLYEGAFDDPARATRHYRKYLSLRPAAADADEVRSWIMEMKTE